MDTKLQFQSKEYELKRYPKTEDKSLRAWSNAELLALDYIAEKKINEIHLFNDRFGVWNTVLQDKNLTTVWTYASQQKAIEQNLRLNNFPYEILYKTPLEVLGKVDIVLIKMPKSLELFELFLQQINNASNENSEVVCAFMTKHFSASFLKIAAKYFDVIEQSRAWKKARLLILKTPIKNKELKELINTITYKSELLKQYYGVFSSGKIDIGTQFLLEELEVKSDELKVLDVASGNGVIASCVLEENPMAEVTLVDDFNLAIDSSKINLKDKKANFICADNLNDLEKESFDLVVSNPPFHFEHENNIEIALQLFKGVYNCLKNNARFVLVANSHLNYQTHLSKIFNGVVIVNSNKKFQIIECVK